MISRLYEDMKHMRYAFCILYYYFFDMKLKVINWFADMASLSYTVLL